MSQTENAKIFLRQILADEVPIFVNPDRMAKEMNPLDPGAVAWDAARAADVRRTECLAAGKSFATETVFSHASKLDFIEEAKAAGFHTRMVFICLEEPGLNLARVSLRVDKGGHSVPPELIAPRYERALHYAVMARDVADELRLYGNSYPNQRPRQVAVFHAGKLAAAYPPIPDWARRAFGPELETS